MKLKSKLITASVSFFIMVTVLVVASRYDVSLLNTVGSTQSAGVITGVNGATSSGTTVVGVTLSKKDVTDSFSFDVHLKNNSKDTVTYKFPDGLITKYTVLDAAGSAVFDSTSVSPASGKEEKFTLKSAEIKKITLQFNPVTAGLSSGTYSIRAEFPGYGVGQNKFMFTGTASPSGPSNPSGSTPTDTTNNRTIGPGPTKQAPIVYPGTPGANATSAATFFLTVKKKVYNLNERVIGKLTVKANGQPITIRINGCTVYVVLDAKAENTACPLGVYDVKIPAGGSQDFPFSVTGASTKGIHILTGGLYGHVGKASMKIGFGADGELVSETVYLDNKPQNVVNPTPLPPVTVPTTTPSSTPPVAPPATPPTGTPISIGNGNEIVLTANDKAGYATLSKTLEGYISTSVDQSDKVFMLALKEAVDGILAETTSSTWNAGWASANPTKPSDLDIIIVPTAGLSPVYTQKKSFLASIFAAIKGLFVAQNTQNATYRVGGIFAKNNKCHKYYDVDWSKQSGVVYQLSEKSKIAEKIKSIFRTKPLSPDAGDLINQGGACSAVATFDSLMKFDVAAASSDAEFKTKRAASPYDNSSYYIADPFDENGNTIPSSNGRKVRNIDVLNTMLSKSSIDLDPSTGTWDTGNYTVATMHTVFNNYGPADFTCDLYFPSDGGFQLAKDKLSSCRTDISFSMIYPDGSGHIENVSKIELGSGQNTVYTVDALKQGDITPDATKIPLTRAENKYVLSKDAGSNYTKLVSSDFSQISQASKVKHRQRLMSGPWKSSTFVACTDKSDVIRNLENVKWVTLENQKVNEVADFTVSTNAKYWTEWEKLTNPWSDPKDAPNFSSCKKADLGAAVKTYQSKIRDWTIRWNKAAYDNKGYVKAGLKNELNIERFWGMIGHPSGSEHKNGFEADLYKAIYGYADCVKSKRWTIVDDIWKKHPELAKFESNWNNKVKTYYNPKIEEIKKTVKCETLLK